MSFEAIISLILFLLFVIVPAVGSNRKKPDGTPRKGQPGQPPQPQAQRQQQQQRVGPAPQPAASPPDDGWEAKLREARRRIEEAMGETSMELPRQQVPTAAPAPATRSPVSGEAARISGEAGLAQERARRSSRQQQEAVRRRRERAAAERASRLRPATSARSEELQVTRLGSAGTYTGRRRRSGAGNLFTQEGLQNGLIWHQILSEPPHRRGRRRTSRLRSP